MADEPKPEDDPTTDPASQADEAGTEANSPADSESPEAQESVQTPEFPDLKPTNNPPGSAADLNRLYDVHVTVAAELGRTNVSIQKLLGLSEGSVFELDRSISSPIELVAQGIPLGNGEVVVVDDSFAIRIKEIYANPA
jgi:flagellar motor switch protein FliN/FliY